ncbi:ABC-type transport system involved in multi-copper enzyme maturation permease subunit [Paenibacillus endophyticus]|uniref:ABC-type transport system involved in multi-copper enzyme maturation permease subunit n=1 Tax=Paenibacillus endophyticus TaxID=1294268 RepID=A0A7W5C898_9BACL|nr:ABC transporter permease [Paenibacillus endophyticus]MBB3152550.1 ABC-type transport system involved in multi-copper enzyme maturation permease subunit [Paenibacillus endophyticus]
MIAVWGLTWKELIRKRVTLMTLIMTILFWIAYWFLAGAIAGGEVHVVTSLGLLENFTRSAMILTLGFFFGAFAVAFLAIFSSVAAITGEAETGVLQSVLARPIKRWKWFMGRWLGFVSYVAIYASLLYVSLHVICWIHTGVFFRLEALLPSLGLFLAVIPLLVSLTMVGSCYISPLGNGIWMTMLYGMGWLGSMIGRFMATGRLHINGMETLETLTGLIKLAMPADALQQRMLSELFSISELSGLYDLNSELSFFSVNGAASNSLLLYSAVYVAALLAAGLLIMRRKDF